MSSAKRRRQIRELDLFFAATPRTNLLAVGVGEVEAVAHYDEKHGLVITRIARQREKEDACTHSKK